MRARQTALELQLLAVAKGGAAELVIKQRQVDAARDLELIAEKQTHAQKALIRAKAEGDKQQLQDDFNQKAIEAARKHDAATATEAKWEYDEALSLLENYLNDKRAALERDFAAGKLGENQYQKDLNALEKAGLDAQKVVNADYRKDNAKANKAAADLEIKEQNRVKNEKRKIEATKQDITNASLEAGMIASDAIISALGEETAAGQAALAIKKTLALAEIAINLQKQLTANALAGAKISAEAPPVTIPLGIAYTVATDTLAVAGSLAAAAKILGFATGGVVPGTGTGDTVPAMLTPGEVVMNQASSQAYAPLLSFLNASYGGASFAPATASRANDGGLAARNAGAGLFPSAAEIGAAVAANVPDSISVREINSAQRRSARVRSLTSLR